MVQARKRVDSSAAWMRAATWPREMSAPSFARAGRTTRTRKSSLGGFSSFCGEDGHDLGRPEKLVLEVHEPLGRAQARRCTTRGSNSRPAAPRDTSRPEACERSAPRRHPPAREPPGAGGPCPSIRASEAGSGSRRPPPRALRSARPRRASRSLPARRVTACPRDRPRRGSGRCRPRTPHGRRSRSSSRGGSA